MINWSYVRLVVLMLILMILLMLILVFMHIRMLSFKLIHSLNNLIFPLSS